MPAPVPRTRPVPRSPWPRLALLVVLLAVAALCVLVWQPQRRLPSGTLPAQAAFVLVYGLCAAAFVPRPVLNLAAGALLGAWAGTVAALGGTLLAAAASFGLGRSLGRDALRLLLRGRLLTAADRHLGERGFRGMLALRLFPGVPFLAVSYGAAVSPMGWTVFLLATAVGSAPGTAAYALAGARAASPASPLFLAALGFLAVCTVAVPAAVAWRRRDLTHRQLPARASRSGTASRS